MRYLILSDIHANLQALNAVLSDAARLEYDETLVLGDLVGYGADPAGVIERVFGLGPAAMVRGNHDKLCAGLDRAVNFSPDARASIEWTTRMLSAEDLGRLASLPAGPRSVEDGILICHGAPLDEDHYIVTPEDALLAMARMRGRLCLFGHTHCPVVFGPVKLVRSEPGSTELRLPSDQHARVLANIGSVGQPRDGNPRAAYGILDTSAHRLLLRRVTYDVPGAQARIRDAGLPATLAERLSLGH